MPDGTLPAERTLAPMSAQAHVTDARDYVALLKPRVMALVVYTGLCGLLLAPGGLHPVLAATAVLCIALGAGAAGAINMWYDRDIDAGMRRTRGRPIPAGRMAPGEALSFGVGLAVGSVLLMHLAVGWPAAAMLALSIGFYVFIYTIWLKRRTPQNIVIGGAAGAFPPVIGWVAVTGQLAIEPLILFAIIFLWTPAHFWALALNCAQDYARVGVPMLPVVSGERETRRQIVVYAAATMAASLVPLLVGMSGLLYGIAAALLGAMLVWKAWRVLQARDPAAPGRMFGYSILYLFALFGAFVADAAASVL
ncbi:MAG: heme o synthase [Acetobacterales bacterium]